MADVEKLIAELRGDAAADRAWIPHAATAQFAHDLRRRAQTQERAADALERLSLVGGGNSSSVAESGSTASPKSDGLCKSEKDWKPTSQAPPEKPGTYINVRSVTTYRWLPYKPDGARQMKKKGRWQRHVGYGFTNAELPENAEWVVNAPNSNPHLTAGGE